MSSRNTISPDSTSVQAHLGIIQSVIQRMATNSSSCKAWCITIVSAILVIIADKSKPELSYITLIPIILFCALDAYYLALERCFRDAYKDFIDKVHSASLDSSDLYDIKPKGVVYYVMIECLFSFSIYPFYLTMFLLVYILNQTILG